MNRSASAELALQRAEQVDHLRAHRHVERGDRLVANEKLRLQRQRARNDDALTLPTGEFVREAVERVGVEPDARGEPHGLGAAVGARPAGDGERQRDGGTDALARIERGECVLEHHLQLVPVRPQRALTQRGEVDGRRAGCAPRSARSAASPAWRWWSCRSRTRRRCRASRRRRARTTRRRPRVRRPQRSWRDFRPQATAWWQATERPPSSRSNGVSARQRASARGQRGAKAQPARKRREVRRLSRNVGQRTRPIFEARARRRAGPTV